MCRLYRAEVKSSRGAWLEAEAEARRASEELRGFIPGAVSAALYTIGEIRLRRGDLEAAEEALVKAHEMGRVEPALSLLRLEQGRTEAASESIARALDGSATVLSWTSTPNSPLTRALLLPAQVEIALAAGDLALARGSADELTTLAATFDVTPIRARALTEAATVSAAEGDVHTAVAMLRDATAEWRRIEAPWDAARARRLLGEALAADGARDSAILELRAAGRALEELGAAPELRRVATALARLGVDAGAGVSDVPRRVLKTFIFTDIVDSTRLASSVGDEAWDRALRWHDHTIRTIVSEHGGEEIKRTGDGFFLAFDDADDALEAARAIQRGLASPPPELAAPIVVRIGAHRAEANRSAMDYLGSGVNLAARLTAAADGGEILASHAALDAARRRYEVSAKRSVDLRGIPEPVEVATVGWS
jgi:class 3 adenylate cyclase